MFYLFIALFLVWQSDVYILTNERLIDFDASTIGFKRVKDTDLTSMHEVSYKAGGGLISGAMDYGDVHIIQIGGSVVMKNIPHPSEVALVIGQAVETARKQSVDHLQPTPLPPSHKPNETNSYAS